MIYLNIEGRIGNQLFMYAFARSVSKKTGIREIVIDDRAVLKKDYLNSLPFYGLENVTYTHDRRLLHTPAFIKQYIIFCLYRLIRKPLDYNRRFALEKKMQRFLNKNGLILCENGYLEFDVKGQKNIFIAGYYQSEKYFEDVAEDIKSVFSLQGSRELEDYPAIEELRKRNSVCISIKVQHNVGDSMYDVCNDGYWQKAIDYMIENVEDPLFFICSDNVGYVKENLIDCKKYDAVFQDSSRPVHVSLAAMAQCRHFIIGNTTFGWWAQYLSNRKDKIVVAPSRWMKIDMPIGIYQDNWHLVEV